MEMNKSSRHSKLTGDFGEALVAYLLSKHGFECNRFDHTGIDLVACNPNRAIRMGISVKSRSRYDGSEGWAVTIDAKDELKVRQACEDFRLEPYLAVVVDCTDCLRVFITSFDHFLSVAKRRDGALDWPMSSESLAKYEHDKHITVMRFSGEPIRWGIAVADATDAGTASAAVSSPTAELRKWKDALASIQNPSVREFFSTELASGIQTRFSDTKKSLIYRSAGRGRWYVTPRQEWAYVWQEGRFPGDEELWLRELGEDIELSPVVDGLTFTLTTSDELAKFKRVVSASVEECPFRNE